MLNSPVAAFAAVFGGIALFTIVLTVWAVRVRRAADAWCHALRAAQVAAECHDLLLGPRFLWSLWQDTAKASYMTQLIRNDRDEIITTITRPAVPLDGVLKHFELDGRRYEICKLGLMSSRTGLREAGSEQVLLCAEHGMLRTTIFQGDGLTPMFVLPTVTVFARSMPIRVGKAEVGKVVTGLKKNAYVNVLTLPVGRCSTLEQVFVLASL